MKIKNLIMLLIGLMPLLSCNSDLVISENKDISGNWDKNDTIIFDFEITDSLAVYDFHINIRHSINYPYRNLYFFVATEFPNGQISNDTIECLLADVRGRWFGNGLGEIKENNILIRQNLQFPRNGLYKISFVQAMRQDVLSGVEDVGIQINKLSAN